MSSFLSPDWSFLQLELSGKEQPNGYITSQSVQCTNKRQELVVVTLLSEGRREDWRPEEKRLSGLWILYYKLHQLSCLPACLPWPGLDCRWLGRSEGTAWSQVKYNLVSSYCTQLRPQTCCTKL